MVTGGTAERRNRGPMHPERRRLRSSGTTRAGTGATAAAPPFRRCAVPPLALALALATVQPAPAQEQIGIPLGERPPAVVLEDLDGNVVDLGEVIGQKPVLVEFWATWCPLCAALEPQLRAAHARYGDDVEFLIVAVGVNQSPRSIRRHLARHDLPGRVLWDGRGAAVRAFQAPSTSYVVTLDATGTVVYTGLGDEQDLERAVAKAAGR